MANDNPQYLWGRKNPNWSGPSKAQDSHGVDASPNRVSGDFSGSRAENEVRTTKEYLSDYLGDAISNGRVVLYGTRGDRSFNSLEEFVDDYRDQLAGAKGDTEVAQHDYLVTMDIRSDDPIRDEANYLSLSSSLQDYCIDHEPNLSVPLGAIMDDDSIISELSEVSEEYEESSILNDYWYDQAAQKAISDVADDEPMRQHVIDTLVETKMSDLEDSGVIDDLDDDDVDSLYEDFGEAYSNIITKDSIEEKVKEQFNRTASIDGGFEFGNDDWFEAACDIVDSIEPDKYPDSQKMINKYRK